MADKGVIYMVKSIGPSIGHFISGKMSRRLNTAQSSLKIVMGLVLSHCRR